MTGGGGPQRLRPPPRFREFFGMAPPPFWAVAPVRYAPDCRVHTLCGSTFIGCSGASEPLCDEHSRHAGEQVCQGGRPWIVWASRLARRRRDHHGGAPHLSLAVDARHAVWWSRPQWGGEFCTVRAAAARHVDWKS